MRYMECPICHRDFVDVVQHIVRNHEYELHRLRDRIKLLGRAELKLRFKCEICGKEFYAYTADYHLAKHLLEGVNV